MITRNPPSFCQGHLDVLPILQIDNGTEPIRHYLPIEFFKMQISGMNLLGGKRRFVSSGTTETGRSISFFSDDGVALYKIGAMSTYYSVLAHYFKNPMFPEVISLVPPTSVWPDSSLAQMITWISEYWHVSFEDPNTVESRCQKFKQPIILFATAYHLMWLLESEWRLLLPQGSVIIETGGYKGKTKELPRKEFYNALQRKFGVTSDFIVSEYGMCESATQAYDFISSPNDESPTPLEERLFFLPSWIEPSVTQRGGFLRPQGDGALVLDDPMRIDYPWPLRTQDFVRLEFNKKAFRLIGRVASAKLKGCSLSAESVRIDIKQKAVLPKKIGLAAQMEMLTLDINAMSRRAAAAQKFLDSLFKDPHFCDLVEKDLGTKNLAKSAIRDMTDGIPSTLNEWQNAAFRSLGKLDEADAIKNWLIILPRSHPQALFHPLFLGYVMGLHLFVRRTTLDSNAAESYVLERISQIEDSRIALLPPTYSVGISALPFQSGALLGFGSDDTIEYFRKYSGIPTNCFGTIITGSVILLSEISENKHLIAKDLFSLGQTGCYSSRYLVVVTDISWELDGLVSALAKASKEFIGGNFTSMANTAIDHEGLRLGLLGAKISNWRELDEPLFALWTGLNGKIGKITEKLADIAYGASLFLINQTISIPDLLEEIMKENPSCRRVSVSPEVMNKISSSELGYCLLGKANTPKWNGLHDGRPLYSVS